MAACVIDEAIRNCVAVGADPERIALLDNFCWGNTERPETLGSLVLAAQACHDLALAYGTPFISGKDSLNNEYTHEGRSLAIPPTLLISAIGQVPDVRSCVTMDLKEPGNLLVMLGHDAPRAGWIALVPRFRAGGRARAAGRSRAGQAFVRGLHAAIKRGLVRSCHDLSEGGLGRRAGGNGVRRRSGCAGGAGARSLARISAAGDFALLFSESPTRFVLEVRPECFDELAGLWAGLPLGGIGEVTSGAGKV